MSHKLRRATSVTADTPEIRAAAILRDLQSGDMKTRSAAILTFARTDARTRDLVEQPALRAVADYQGEEDDFSDWRALDREPFHFPEETEESSKVHR